MTGGGRLEREWGESEATRWCTPATDAPSHTRQGQSERQRASTYFNCPALPSPAQLRWSHENTEREKESDTAKAPVSFSSLFCLSLIIFPSKPPFIHLTFPFFLPHHHQKQCQSSTNSDPEISRSMANGKYFLHGTPLSRRVFAPSETWSRPSCCHNGKRNFQLTPYDTTSSDPL